MIYLVAEGLKGLKNYEDKQQIYKSAKHAVETIHRLEAIDAQHRTLIQALTRVLTEREEQDNRQ